QHGYHLWCHDGGTGCFTGGCCGFTGCSVSFYVLFPVKRTKTSPLRIFEIMVRAKNKSLQTSNIRMWHIRLREGMCNVIYLASCVLLNVYPKATIKVNRGYVPCHLMKLSIFENSFV